ncbi:MAG: acetylglutamate kinase, partial [Dehalococcoidales bacterium]|nr:acetylglutamate kinase [Dehalococcoidales bacterium]
DGGLIESTVRDRELGYVGGVVRVNGGVLETLLRSGYMPVVSPVSLYAVARPDGGPVMVNVNGDPVAGAIAAALKAERLIYLTDVDGVKDKSGAAIRQLTAKEAEALISSGVIAGGMIPKVNACLEALKAGCTARIIDGSKPHALVQEIESVLGGTTILP